MRRIITICLLVAMVTVAFPMPEAKAIDPVTLAILAPIAIKAAGVSCVIAKSFARIFYRNSINIGLPIMECPEAVDAISNGDVVSVDADTGTITDETTGETFTAQPFPPFLMEIINAGGLVPRWQKKLGKDA